MKHPYLTTRKSSRNFYFRRAVPEPLRAVLPREIWISLQTPSRELALACLPDAARAFEKMVATARQQLDDRQPDLYQPLAHCGPPVKLTPELIERVAERYFVHALASEAEQRLGITDDELTERETLVATAREQTRRARARADATYLAELAELALDIVTAEHLYVRPDSELFEQLVAALHKKDIAVLDEELARLRGDGEDTPTLPPLVAPAQPEPEPTPPAPDSWAAVLQSWQRLKAPSAQTYSEAAREVERFVAVVGNKPLHAITHADIEAYKAARVAGIKLATMNKNLTMLSALLGHAITTNLCPLLKNPFTGAKYASNAVNRDRVHRRDAYSSDQLNLLLHSPVYLDGYRPACGGEEAAYWLPLLGLMTGARLEDLCRIRPDDVFQREKVWCLRLHDSKRESRLGATAVIRDVPLHDDLLRAGFLDFVAQRRRLAPAERLFPELTRNARGKYGKRFGDWYGRYIDHIGLDDPSLDFHSLRHSFEAFCAESGLSAEDTDALLGHAPDADYGRNEDGEKRRPFSALVKAVRKLRFRGVAMAHLFAAAAQLR